jgi:hypothetical protein
MPPENAFRKLKKAVLPSWATRQRILDFKSALVRDHRMVGLVKECLVELKRQSVRQKPAYQSHLHNLAHPAEFDGKKVAVGYQLERAARKLKPTFVVEGDRSKPVLCMVCIGKAYGQAVEIGTRTKVDYCKRHGYSMVILEAAPLHFDRPITWLRIPLIFSLMEMGHNHVFYLDADTLITNQDVGLEPFFARLEKAERHLMIAEDILSLNTGSFFVRKTWQSLTLLDLIYENDAHLDHYWWEQQALIELTEQHQVVRSLLYLETDARQFNSVPLDFLNLPLSEAERTAYSWQPGDFVCHFAGLRNTSMLQEKMGEIHGLPGPDRNGG